MPSLPSATSNYRVIASAIGQELRVRYEPPNGLSSELRRLLGQIPCSDTVRKAVPVTRYVAYTRRSASFG
jgi:hypothetical protein